MTTICSFCNAVIRPGASPDEPVSHGVCESCKTKIYGDFRFEIRKFLDMLDAPVFLVDGNADVLGANQKAIALTGKPVSEIAGHVCGKVLACINSHRPEGCGKTPDCPDCAIRSSVIETWNTGKPVNSRPAHVFRKLSQREKREEFLVSTRKDGDVVLLRLEPRVS
jgi:PAS domain-containing protein